MMGKINKKIIFIVLILLILVGIVCFNIFNIDSEKLQLIDFSFDSRVEEISNFNYEDHFVLGWLQVQGTNIDLPIFTSTFSLLEEQGKKSIDFNYAWRNINYRNGENRLAIIGHNILNLSSKPLLGVDNLTDFEQLMSFVYYDFAKENMYAMYTKPNGDEDVYVVYAVSFINSYDDYGYSISYDDKDELDKYIDNAKENSIYDYQVDVNSDDDIISLLTCTRFFGLSDRKVFKLDLRKVREDEKLYKYPVLKNENYTEVTEQINKESI